MTFLSCDRKLIYDEAQLLMFRIYGSAEGREKIAIFDLVYSTVIPLSSAMLCFFPRAYGPYAAWSLCMCFNTAWFAVIVMLRRVILCLLYPFPFCYLTRNLFKIC